MNHSHCRLLRGESEEDIGPELLQQLQTRLDVYLADRRAELGIKLDSMRVVQTGAPSHPRLGCCCSRVCAVDMHQRFCICFCIVSETGLRYVPHMQSSPCCATASSAARHPLPWRHQSVWKHRGKYVDYPYQAVARTFFRHACNWNRSSRYARTQSIFAAVRSVVTWCLKCVADHQRRERRLPLMWLRQQPPQQVKNQPVSQPPLLYCGFAHDLNQVNGTVTLQAPAMVTTVGSTRSWRSTKAGFSRGARKQSLWAKPSAHTSG